MNSFLLMLPFWLGIVSLTLVGMIFLILPLYRVAGSMSLTQKKYSFALIIFFPILVLGLYSRWGASDQLLHWRALQKISYTLEKIDQRSMPQEVIAQFKQLESQIDFSSVALAQLGDLYRELGLFEEAIFTLDKAIQQDPHNKTYWARWVYVNAMQHRGRLPDLVREKAQMLVSENELSHEILNLLAIDDYLHQRFQAAIEKWEWLLEKDLDLSDPKRAALESAILTAKNNSTG